MKEIKSVEQFMKELKTDINTDDIYWFRGQANISWGLIPSLYRGAEIEDDLISRFKQNATFLLEKSPNTEFDWLFLMQHYDVPTRLLDWSDNPLVALYFAVADDTQMSKDAAFWYMKPLELNLLANVVDGKRVPSLDDDWLNNYKPSDLKMNRMASLNPIAIIAPRNNPRMQAQAGVFTIWHKDKKSIDKLGIDKFVYKYKIPADSKKIILEELKLIGVNKFRLFPELGSISSIILEV